MDTNYFVCTLGQAASPEISTPFQNVNHLIDQQAMNHPELPAVGFYIPEEKQKPFQTRVLTFKEILNGVVFVASAIEGGLKDCQSGQTVGLLSDSSPAFLFIWLGLIRLGHPVLLIAPQCSASAVAHLCKACDVQTLFHDAAHERLAAEAVISSKPMEYKGMTTKLLPFSNDEEVFQLASKEPAVSKTWPEIADADIAYLHHTSGTSTGIPKPIPQTHRGGVCVLPALDGKATATFTTTPLYHGGVADLFRAWASAGLIWLFPSHHAPITGTNIVNCLLASSERVKSNSTPQIKYFSSVPYVLQMMAQDNNGRQHLQKMDIVGVGGAALPPEVGDELVRDKIHLISRYGSAECGFLMSSFRDFTKDEEWQYLRQPETIEWLKFEKQEDEQSELIVLPGWPHMAKLNRQDGSFATSDLFAPHPTIPNAWRYHSRADSQLTLVTGKKFDPAPLEGALAAATPLLNEVFIFGNGRPYPGALIFKSEEGQVISNHDFIQKLAPIVEKLNRESQSHARIPRNMLVPMSYEPVPLEKSSKGTILRGAAEHKFRDHIESAYSKTTFNDTNVDDEDLPGAISRIIQSVVGDSHHDVDLETDTDLFAYGVDSVASVQIRHSLSQLLPKDAEKLPLTVIQDSGTIAEIAQTVSRYRKGQQALDERDSSHLLEELINKYSSFVPSSPSAAIVTEPVDGYTVLLTGPTGLLGAHILSQLMAHENVKKIYLLVRGATQHAARERVLKSLELRMIPLPDDFDERIHVLPCKLSDSNLGLSDGEYQLITDKVDKIFHLAWAVNFLVSLSSLGTTHLSGLQNLLNLALLSKRKPQFLFCSSIASVSNYNVNGSVPESIIQDVSACGATGYAQSKLAAELICAKCADTTHMKGWITILRVGQLSGDRKAGVWNASEAYPLMLASGRATKALPDLPNETLGWLPVDVAATAYLEAAFKGHKKETINGANEPGSESDATEVQVLHLINTSQATTFADLTKCIQDYGEDVQTVSVGEWLKALERLQDNERFKSHPALKLLSFWKQAYGSEVSASKSSANKSSACGAANYEVNGTRKVEKQERYETTVSKEVMPALRDATGPLTREYMLKLWRWVKESVY